MFLSWNFPIIFSIILFFFLVHFVSYLSLKQFTKCIFWRLVSQFPAALIGRDWKQQNDNLGDVQRFCKEPRALWLCSNNSVLMKWWDSQGPLKLGLGEKLRLSGRCGPFTLLKHRVCFMAWVIEACCLQRNEPRLILVSSGLGLWFTV